LWKDVDCEILPKISDIRLLCKQVVLMCDSFFDY